MVKIPRALGVTLIVGAIAAAAVAVGSWTRGRAGSLPTTLARKGTFVDYLQVRGEIRPVRSVVMTAPSSGSDMQIVQLAANGTALAAGDVVARLDPTSHQRQLEEKRSELKMADSEVRKAQVEGRRRVQAAEAELAEARSAVARARLDVAAADLVPRIDAEKSALVLASSEHHVAALEEKVAAERQAADADLAIARRRRDKTGDDLAEAERVIASLTLRAPAAGTFSLLPNTRAGGPMNRSAPEFRRGDRVWFGAPIAELPDLSAVRMTSRLDEADRARVQVGTRALVRVDALPDRELEAQVGEISLVARPDFSSWPPVRNFDVVIAIDAADARLRSGMSATARIELEKLTDVVIVPSAALFRDGSVAYVVDGRSVVERRVTVLRRGRDETAILAGLQAGERVALRDPAAPEGE
jgi:multidrug resistance efflux pump